jgi:hypothetical protein
MEGSSWLSLSSCCIWRYSCVGFRSPNWSALSNCFSRCCSDADVRLTSFFLQLSVGIVSWGLMRSRTFCATSSGWRELTPYAAYLVRSAAMFRVVNRASTCETRALGHGETVQREFDADSRGDCWCCLCGGVVEVEAVAEELIASCCCWSTVRSGSPCNLAFNSVLDFVKWH